MVLLLGPIITIILGKLGHSAVKVFYRRFIEAWINLRNVEEMLGDHYTELMTLAKKEPLFKSKHGGFIARFEREEIECIIKKARRDGLDAETVVERVTEKGDTLSYAKRTLLVFEVVSVILFITIILIFTLDGTA